ncbi:coiled-coil domain-containing protein 63-like [Dendropsophus ebraccatus]|uniref:coiled-coil domain-containing protein 63-like n=1 Tax=Dendropsophus ebraccatus TaxID=150705 RepID=UPI0038311D9D
MRPEKKLDWHLPNIDKNEGPPPTEKDLKTLQEQLRVTEMTKRSFKEQTEQYILSQQKEISQLREQQKDLKLTLLFSRSRKNILKDQENVKKLSELTEAQDKYKHLIEEQRNLISDLDIKIKDKEKELVKQKKEASKPKNIGRTQIAQLENQLQHITQKYNMMNIENAKLRENIDYLRCKKTAFQHSMEELQQKVTHQKAAIEKIQEQIMSAHKEKAEIQTKSLAFKNIADREIKKYDTKIDELTRYVDGLKNQKQFMEAKWLDRSAMAREQSRKRREKILEEKRKLNQEIIDEHNSLCEELGNLLGQQNVDLSEMAKQYTFNEMRNYSLFTYVNELHSEEVAIKQEIKAIEDELLKLESQNRNTLNEQQISIKQLQENLHETSEAAEKYKNKHLEMTRDLQTITSAIEDLVKNLDCDLSSMKKMFGCDMLTFQDKLQYFKILEMKMDDLIQVLNFCALRDRIEGSFSSTSIPSILEASEISCSVGAKKVSLPAMPKTIKATGKSVGILEFVELRKKVLHDVVCKENKAKEAKKHGLDKYGLNENT